MTRTTAMTLSKTIFSTLFFLLVLNLPPSKVSAFSGTGTGEISSPYVIRTCEQLQEIKDEPGKNYVLGQDIDCSGTSTWNQSGDEYLGFEPIGGGYDFWGILDGAYYTIYDLYINRPEDYSVGIFHTVEGGVIGSLTIERAYVNGYQRVAALVGQSAEGEYYDIHVVDSEIISASSISDGKVGGLIGYNQDEMIMEGCSFDGTITGDMFCGGLVGYSGGDISISESYSDAVVNCRSSAGGLVGFSDSILSIEDSYNSGSVNGFYRIGGLVGYSTYDFGITDSYNEAQLIGYYKVGGLVGSSSEKVTILRSYNEGDIISSMDNYQSEEYLPTWIDEYICIGGLVGASWKADILKSYNLGSLEAIGGSRSVGGILGCGGLVDVQETYNKGNIDTLLTSSLSVPMDGVGGLIGMVMNMKLKNSYNSGDLNVAYWDDCVEPYNCGILPYSGGLVGTSVVSSMRNSYNRGNITVSDSEGDVNEGGIGGLLGYLLLQESLVDDVINNLGKDFVARVTTYIAEVINNFAIGLITNNFSDDDVYVGGLIGMLFVANCTENDCASEYINFQNNWWFNGISKAIGYITGDTSGMPSMYSNDQEGDRFERASAMEIFKEYSHKVYNTDPEWDFDTIWNSVYDGKGYPVLGIQSLVTPNAPIANVASGTYASAFSASLSSAGSSSIRYTVNGSVPTCSTGTVYTAPIQISVTSVVRAIGCIDGIGSDLSEFSYIMSSGGSSAPTLDTTPSLTKLASIKNTSNTLLEELVEEEVVVEEEKEIVQDDNSVTKDYFRIRIVDKKGNPLVGTEVIVEGKKYITDSNGEIVIRDLEKGEYSLKIKYDGKEYSEDVVLGDSDEVIDITVSDRKEFPWWVVLAGGFVLILIFVYRKLQKVDSYQ